MGRSRSRRGSKLAKQFLREHGFKKPSDCLILQKSTMCESYLKQITRQESNKYYHKFKITGNNMNKRIIFKSFNQLVKNGTFHPVKFTLADNTCTFLAKSCIDLIMKIIALKFMVPRYKNTNHDPDEYFKSVAIVYNYVKVDEMPTFRDNMVDILHKRITGDTIDLRNFSEDPDLDATFLLSNKHQFKILMTRITHIRKWQPKTILLSDNYISDIEGLTFVSKTVTTLDLSNNLIEDLESLKVLTHFKELKSLNLLGNPVCKKLEFKSEVLKYCPSITRLEDDTVCEQVSLKYKRNFVCCNEAENLASAFLEHFFTLYDRSRTDLISLYSSHAMFSVNATIIPNQKNSDAVTLEHYGLSAPFTVFKLSEIMDVFAEFPKSYHDPYPMVCDVTVFTKTSACLIVSGIFRELNQVLSFTRSFYFRRMGDIISITNEQLHVNNATDVQVGWGFSFPLDVKYFGNPLPYYYEQYSKLEEVMCKITTMNLTYARKYLVYCHYDLKKALELFGNLHVNDEVPAAAFQEETKEKTDLGGEKLPLNEYLRKKVLGKYEEITVRTTWSTLNQDRMEANCDPPPQKNPTIDKWYRTPYSQQFGFKIPESVWKLQNVVLPKGGKLSFKISGKSSINEKKIESPLDAFNPIFQTDVSSNRCIQQVPRSSVYMRKSTSRVQIPVAEPSFIMSLPSSKNIQTESKTSAATSTDNPLLRLSNRIAQNKEMALKTLQNLNAKGESRDTPGSVTIGMTTRSPSTITSNQSPQGSSSPQNQSTPMKQSGTGSSNNQTQESRKHLDDGQKPSTSGMAFVKGSINSNIIQMLKKGIQDQQASMEKVKSIISAKEKRMASLKEQRTNIIDLTSEDTEVVESKNSESEKSSKPTEVAHSLENNDEKSISTNVKQTVVAEETLPRSAIKISKPIDVKQSEESKPKDSQQSHLIKPQFVDNDLSNKSDTQKPQTTKQSISTTKKQSQQTDNKQVQLSDVEQSQPTKPDNQVIQLSDSQASKHVKPLATNIKQAQELEVSDPQPNKNEEPADTKHVEVVDSVSESTAVIHSHIAENKDSQPPNRKQSETAGSKLSVSETAVVLHSELTELKESQLSDGKQSELADNKEAQHSDIKQSHPPDSILQPERADVMKHSEATGIEESKQANVTLCNPTSTEAMRPDTSKETKSEVIVDEKSEDLKRCIRDHTDASINNPELSTITPKDETPHDIKFKSPSPNLVSRKRTNTKTKQTDEFKEYDNSEIEHKRAREKSIKLEAADIPESCIIKDNEEVDCKRIKLENPLKSETLSSVKTEDKTKTQLNETKKIKQIKQKDMFKKAKYLMADFKRQLIIRLRRMTVEEISLIIRHRNVPSDITERTSQPIMTKHKNKADSIVKPKLLKIHLPKMSIDDLKVSSSQIVQEKIDNATSFKSKPTRNTIHKAVFKETNSKTDLDHSELKLTKPEASSSQPMEEETVDAGVSQCNPVESKPFCVVSKQETNSDTKLHHSEDKVVKLSSGSSHPKEEKLDNTATSKSNPLESIQINSNTKPGHSDPKHIELVPRSRAEKRKDKSSTNRLSSAKHKRPKSSVEVTEEAMVVDNISETDSVDKKLKSTFKIPKLSEVTKDLTSDDGTKVKEEETQSEEDTRSILQNYVDEDITYDKRNSQRIAGNLWEQKEDINYTANSSESKILENKEILDNRKDYELSEKTDIKESGINSVDRKSSEDSKSMNVTTVDQISDSSLIASPKIPKLPKEEPNVMEIEDNATVLIDPITTKGIKINLKTKLPSPSKQQIIESKKDIELAGLTGVTDGKTVDHVKPKDIKVNLLPKLSSTTVKQHSESKEVIISNTSTSLINIDGPERIIQTRTEADGKNIKLNLITKFPSTPIKEMTDKSVLDLVDSSTDLTNKDLELEIGSLLPTGVTEARIMDTHKSKDIKLNLFTKSKSPKKEITESEKDTIVPSTSCNIDELKVPAAHTADGSDANVIVETEQRKNVVGCLSENLANDKIEPLKKSCSGENQDQDHKKDGNTREIKNSQLSLLSLEVDDSSGDDDDLLNFFKY